MDARDPLLSLPPRKGRRTEEADGDGGSGAMPSRRCSSLAGHVELLDGCLERGKLMKPSDTSSKLSLQQTRYARDAAKMMAWPVREDCLRFNGVLLFQGFEFAPDKMT